MKTIKPASFLLLLVSILLICCSKKDTATVATTSKTDYLTAKNWMLTALTVTSPTGDIDAYASLKACEKDDLTKYNVNHTIISMPGANKCDPSEPASSPAGTWSFTNNETKLQIIDTDTSVVTLITLSATTLKGTMIDNSSGINQTITMTFTAQ